MKKLIRQIIRWITLLILGIFSFFNQFLPKNSHIILLFTYNKGFVDNNRAMFEYLVDNRLNETHRIFYAFPEYKACKGKGLSGVRFIPCWQAVFVFLFAKYCFYDTGTLKIRPSKKQMVIQLWHGTPLKKLDKTVNNDTIKGDHYDDFTYAVCCAPIVKPLLARAFECSEDKVVVTGYPRNDALFNKEDYLQLLGIDGKSYKKLIFWMPTFRVAMNGRHVDSLVEEGNTTGLQLFGTDAALTELNTFLKEHQFYLVIKLHPLASLNNQDYQAYSNIFILNNQKMNQLGIQNYKLLSNFDALITDYSSVYFDWLLTSRPLGFVVEDMASYSSMRGFAFEEPLKYMPGPKIQTRADFYAFCTSLSGKDEWMEARADMNKLFNTYQDDQSCSRVLELAGIK